VSPVVTPNTLAWLALAAWPVVVFGFYAYRSARGRVAATTAWMMILPVMFLPSALAFKTPGVPSLDKDRISFLAIALALALFHRPTLRSRAPWRHFPVVVIAVLSYGIFRTVHLNPDVLTFGPTVLPGLTGHDIPSNILSLILDLYLPFFVGQKVFRTERDLRDLFRVLTTCALLYAPFMLIELRLSPQFHNWVYGYHPSAFLQGIRGSGYRPTVFMKHGLSVAMFSFTTLCAAIALAKVRARLQKPSARVRVLVSGGLVVACKSLGPFIYSLAIAPLIILFSNRLVRIVVLVLAVGVVAYPTARATGWFPTKEVVSFFARIDGERAFSLGFRFNQEDELLRRARERPAFGWGTFGRNRVYASWGQDVSITDGYWVIALGIWGFFGFAGFFAMLVVPLLRYVWNSPRLPWASQVLMGSLALIVVTFTVDLLPNARSDHLPIAYAGALFTLAGAIRRPVRKSVTLRRAPRSLGAQTAQAAAKDAGSESSVGS
jgi:hypothetical protein